MEILLRIIAVMVIAAAMFVIVVPLLDQPAVADQSAAVPTVVSRQPSLDDLFRDFADRIAAERIRTWLNTAPTIVPQQPPIVDPPQDLADRMALDQRLQRLEQQIQTWWNMQNTRERAVRTPTETFPKTWVRQKQTITNYRHRRRYEIDGTALAGKTVDANPAAHRAIAKASGCPASVPCVERGTGPFTAPPATREYDEAGNEVK